MTADAPTPDFVVARAAMVDSQLKPQGVADGAILEAMAAIPREDFVAPEARAFAYSDRAVPAGEGRYLAAPSALGQLLVALAPVAGERALIVGGNGYSAAVLRAMGVNPEEADIADLDRLPDGQQGGIDFILIDGAVPTVPQALVDRIGEGGRIGGAIVDRGVTRLFVGRKSGGSFGSRTIGDVGMPVLPGFAAPVEFQF